LTCALICLNLLRLRSLPPSSTRPTILPLFIVARSPEQYSSKEIRATAAEGGGQDGCNCSLRKRGTDRQQSAAPGSCSLCRALGKTQLLCVLLLPMLWLLLS
jgi:hypothetical protein